MLKIFSILISLSFFIVSCSSVNSKTDLKDTPGEKIFKTNCAGCHASGGNLIKKDKKIIGSKIISSKETLAAFLKEPHSPMPAFKNISENTSKLEKLYAYVITLMDSK